MPYLTEEDKKDLQTRSAKHPGELNYLFTKIIMDYFVGHPCYQSINDILGALEGAKLEFYRRVVSVYEDDKKDQNGDVYPISYVE